MFIAVDLKVVEGLAAAVGRAGGMSEDAALAGLVRLWHRCWADEIDVMTGDEISGLFAFDAGTPNGSARAIAALVAFGFLEPLPDMTWRVRGSARYLRLKESRRRGAAATNAAKAKNARSKSVAKSRSRASLSDAQSRSSTESPSHRVTEKENLPPASREPKSSDPRFSPLVGRLKASFEACVGTTYTFSDADGGALKNLMKRADDDEIDRRFRTGLSADQYSTKCATVLQLAQRWNELAVKRATTTGPPKGAATAAETDWSNYKPGDTARELFGDKP